MRSTKVKDGNRLSSEAIGLRHTPTPNEALAELIQLLEDYAPGWYTEEQHLRATAALESANNPSVAATVEVALVHA